MNPGIDPKAEAILKERFGHDVLMALATEEDGLPSVRTVNAWYHDGAFYSITYAASNKMRHLSKNPRVGLCGEWFTAHGVGENLGAVLAPQNRALWETLSGVFSSWIANGHTDENDPNTVILKVRLTDGVLFSHGTRYDLTF
jgi:general stress protein 26